jgi:restriction endonuclease S subunit
MGINQNFLAYCLSTKDFKEKIKLLCYGGAQENIGASDLGNILIPVQSSARQAEIVMFLDQKTVAIDEAINLKNHIHTHLSDLRASIVENTIFDTEVSAMKIQLRRVVALQTIKQGPNQSVPIITLENVESWTGKLLGYTEYENITGDLISYKNGDVLFNKLRPYLAKVHVAGADGLCTGEMLVLRPEVKKVDPRFLFYYLVSKRAIDTVNVATYGVKMPRANWEIVGSLEINLPSLDEQRKIVTKLDTKLAQIANAETKLQKSVGQLEEYRASLISSVVVGRQSDDR